MTHTHAERDGSSHGGFAARFEWTPDGRPLPLDDSREVVVLERSPGRTSTSIICEVRLDNRAEILFDLGVSGTSGDVDLLLLGYETWGTGLAERLAGDFVFVIHDPERRAIYAARDPLGAKPLFFSSSGTRIAFATDVGRLLELAVVPVELDPLTVRDYVRGSMAHLRSTFFRGVHRVAPGHFVLARDRTLREVRYWLPPAEEISLSREECTTSFRHHVRAAVASRLETDAPIVAQLSGGLDSSTIACLADRMYREDGRARPPLVLASATYPGLECDERPLIDAVAARVRFRSERYDATALRSHSDRPFFPDHPWRLPRPNETDGLRRLVAREGARVLLSGLGGDQLLVERGVFRDLALNGRFLALAHEIGVGPLYSANASRIFLLDALAALARAVFRRLAPARARASRADVRREKPPRWAGPAIRSLAGPSAGPPLHHWPSETQRWTWGLLTSPELCWGQELAYQAGARAGYEVRFPWLDSRLARFVLSLPFERRLPRGLLKRLQRDAFADILPAAVATRRNVTTFESLLRLQAEHNVREVRAVIEGGSWASAPFVERREARRQLELLASDFRLSRWTWLWNVAMLELWLRRRQGDG